MHEGAPTKEASPSPNPSGRPVGARNRTTLAAEALLDGEAEALIRKAVELGLQGDLIALRICLDRILPKRRERPFRFPRHRRDIFGQFKTFRVVNRKMSVSNAALRSNQEQASRRRDR